MAESVRRTSVQWGCQGAGAPFPGWCLPLLHSGRFAALPRGEVCLQLFADMYVQVCVQTPACICLTCTQRRICICKQAQASLFAETVPASPDAHLRAQTHLLWFSLSTLSWVCIAPTPLCTVFGSTGRMHDVFVDEGRMYIFL